MTFWATLAAVALLGALWIARPFLKRGTMEMDASDSTMSIYRDQLAEVERDRDAGLISAEECEAARKEIERRALSAARNLDRGFFVGHRSVLAAAAITGLSVLAAVGTYSVLGRPGTPDQPLAVRQAEILAQRAAAGDPRSRIQVLIEATESEPENFENWWLLAQAHAALGDNASAAEAYRHAAELSGNDPSVLSAYGEAMTLANGNKVPAAARVIFEQILTDRPDPRARYYVALAKAQAQDFQGAIDEWAALAKDSAPDAPWMPLVRRDIINMARFLEAEVTDYLPDATDDEVALAGGSPSGGGTAPERIDGLRTQLDADPMDHNAWIELATLEAGQGNSAAALEAIETARGHFRAAPFVLQKLDSAARNLGLDILATAGAVKAPSAEDIAAASDLTQDEQDDMIAGMVAGLAAKLEENPDNPDGWIMLVRSYSVMGNMEKARATYAEAEEHFSGNEAVLERLRNRAATTLLP